MVYLHIQIVVKGLWQHVKWDPTSFLIILTNDGQKLTTYRFENKTDANRIRKDFVYIDV